MESVRVVKEGVEGDRLGAGRECYIGEGCWEILRWMLGGEFHGSICSHTFATYVKFPKDSKKINRVFMNALFLYIAEVSSNTGHKTTRGDAPSTNILPNVCVNPKYCPVAPPGGMIGTGRGQDR